jgi:ferritin
MINNKIQKAINEQIKEELYSAYLYLSMSAYCANQNFTGFANWFEVQAKEEMDHAMGFYKHLLKRNGKVELEEIAKPPLEFKSVSSLFEEALKHEKYITSKINKLRELSETEKDYAFESFIRWYIDEQVEEEENANAKIDAVKLIEDKGSAMYLLDKELMARTYIRSSVLDLV